MILSFLKQLIWLRESTRFSRLAGDGTSVNWLFSDFVVGKFLTSRFTDR